MDEAALEARLYPPRQASTRFAEPDHAKIHTELKRNGVTPQLLWSAYVAEAGERAYPVTPSSPNGAGASATLYSIIETAKANGQEPYRYLRYLFTELPTASSPEQVAPLLPFNITPQEIPDP